MFKEKIWFNNKKLKIKTNHELEKRFLSFFSLLFTGQVSLKILTFEEIKSL